ncbi:class III lanthionine synthetase LanKC [Melittangium boletus]|uniref:Serine/threonine protein kinase n=1 Tax=Melittangium boletus DSM 14713 TaxID=1294270 RepID=A0A250IS27_9BACT|nr:class III lanthionine synthetase LanKC [Melittangium boletus]ATB34078.1 serine/threonine protein kinase [Melittangium boletus DSM 14713]
MEGIERRARKDLYLFTLLHPERYEGLERYQTRLPGFGEYLAPLLPAGWRGAPQGIWYTVVPPKHRVPTAGFKLHLSAIPEHARPLLSAIVPVLVEEGVTFKVLVDDAMLDLNNSSIRSSGSCGKFVTLYPRDSQQFFRLLERLEPVTRDFVGPYILSDRPYRDSKVLFYRYGTFLPSGRINLHGERDASFLGQDGRLVEDPRLPYFSLPEGVSDPFPEAPGDEDESGALNGRYEPLSTLGTSSKGGVYLCRDLQTGREVVIKEARPHVNQGRHQPHDAVACLENERRVLRVLEGTGAAPRLLDSFQEWEHHFVVMERAPGLSLAQCMGRDLFGLTLEGSPSAERVRTYLAAFTRLARQLITHVRAIHAQGVVIRDLAPQNILFDADSGRVTLIDFESAYSEHAEVASPLIPLATPGFGLDLHPPPLHEKPTRQQDLRALGRVLGDLLHPVAPFFALAPERRQPLLEHFARERGIPEVFLRLVFAAEEPARFDALLDEAERTVPPPASRYHPRLDAAALRARIDGAAHSIEEQLRHEADPLDLPTDYRRCVTNRLGVAYGASGIAVALQRMRGAAPERLVTALVEEAARADHAHYPPGLFVGMAGIAWSLLELGQREEAERLLATAAESPLLGQGADLFYGDAGWGLTQLFFHHRLRDARALRQALDAAARIEAKLEKTPTGLRYVNQGDVYCGLAHGSAGIGYFLLRLYEATREPAWLERARALLDHDLARGQEHDSALRFPRSEREPIIYPYWAMGGAGLGALALRFHAVMGEPRYLQTARRIAQGLRGQYTVFPSHFYGMAGLGHFFVDLHQHTGEAEEREEALRFAERSLLFAIDRPSGWVSPGEGLLRVSTDYATGSAGIGVLLHRLLAGGGVPYLDF